jgi:pimeloyl-ACP methyl ester carboxylesterase
MPRIAIHGTDMAYQIRGEGEPLLLVAGTGYPGATWPPELVEALAVRHEVITFDHRGTGDTPPGGERYSTRGFAVDAIALLEALGRPATHVVGHSMGGRVAQWMVLDAPRRIRSLVLAATGPGQFVADKPVTRGIPIHTALDLVEQGYPGYMADHIASTFFTPEFAAARPDQVDRLFTAFWEHRPSLEEYLRHVVARQEHQTAERLAEITVPTLVLVGERDTHVAGTGVHWDQSRYLADHIVGSEFAVVEGAAHGYFWQMPGRSAEIILDWTARH